MGAGVGAGAGAGVGAGTGAGTGAAGTVPETECAADGECGVSFECLSCSLTASAGWCVQTMECSFDADCGEGNRCGFRVEDAKYRCLPATYCAD
jgi:hypothetical protein